MLYRPGYFRREHPNVRLGWDNVESTGLRQAQLGAAWALAAHSTVSEEPALVVLPTGVGKTMVLALAPYLYRARRVLVVTPGKLIRAQVAEAFNTLSDLKRTGVLPDDTPSPKVALVEHRAGASDWNEWRKVDVIVGTPNVLSDGYPEVERVPKHLFDLLIFDEAHHLPARVWTALLGAVGAPAVLLTATPVRRDGKALPGELVYSYPLRAAIADRVYAPVRFTPVEVQPNGDVDRALARAAARGLADPVHREAGSRLLVRTGIQAEARALVEFYAEEGVRLGLVLGDSAPSTVRRTLSDVRDGALDGFACVGAMIEGFDFPSLKLAAYHHPHRSLAPTLQFLGRLSRVGTVRGELLAVPSEVEGETRDLYRDDRDWAELMPDIVDAAMREEREVRRHLAGARITGPLDVSTRALTPPRSARIYRVPAGVEPILDVQPERLGHGRVVFRLLQEETSLVAFVTHRVVRQRWAQTTILEVPEFELHLATWVVPQRVLFVSTESGPALDDLLALTGVDDVVRRLAPDDLVRLVWAADPGSYFSVGLRAAHTRRAMGASYDMTAGPAVETALGHADRQNMLGHLMARPRSGNRGTLGFSVAKSKLWEPDNAQSLLEFRRWAVERATELDRPAPSGSLPNLDVQLGQPFDAFEAEVLAAAIDPRFLLGAYVLRVAGATVPAGNVEALTMLVDEDTLEITLVVADEPVWRGHQTVSGRVLAAEGIADVVHTASGELMPVERALQDAPLAVFLADGSVVIGELRTPSRQDLGALPAGVLSAGDWTGIDIEREVGGEGSVHARILHVARQDADWVATDHGSGELADFVAVRRNDRAAHVRLYHCKAAGHPVPRRQLTDLYEVLGQVAKSVGWTVSAPLLLAELARRERDRKPFRVLHGEASAFRAWLDASKATPPLLDIEIIAVQPGVSVRRVDAWPQGRALLHAAVGWCDLEHVAFHLLASD